MAAISSISNSNSQSANVQAALAYSQRQVQQDQNQVQQDTQRLSQSQLQLSRDQAQLTQSRQQSQVQQQQGTQAAAPAGNGSTIAPATVQAAVPAALTGAQSRLNTQGQTIGSLINVTA